MIRKCKSLVAFMLICAYVNGQRVKSLSLDDMSNFKSTKGNWFVVGSVSMDRTKDVHDVGNAAVSYTDGEGILLNMNDKEKNSALLTTWEHGDIELEFEVMLPKGSNSGVYMQGRYEVQLLDSWGVKTPSYGDIGGLYRNWDADKELSYMGKAPMTNSAKAPGLWQKMFISFQAPRFDNNGKKIKNAVFKEVRLNGALLHENYEIPRWTGGEIRKDEVAKGPIMIQGDHGPVAFKNMTYRLLEADPITISNVSYKYKSGPFLYESEYKDLKPERQGTSPEGLTWTVAENKGQFGLTLNADLNLPYDDSYTFEPIYNGKLAIYVDGNEVMKNRGAWDWDRFKSEPVKLTAGKHQLTLYYSRKDTWKDPALGLAISSDRLAPQNVHSLSSYFVKSATPPIHVIHKGEPVILRAFLDFEGKRSLRRTHTVGVGDPTGMNYVFDNGLGALSCIWRGRFVDATPMWFDRGDGSFRPLGEAIYLDNTPQIDAIGSINDPLPTAYGEGEFRSRGYKIDQMTKTPIFHYIIKGLEIEDKTYADAVSLSLKRTVKVKNTKPGVIFRLAKGKEVTKISDSTYLIDGSYYLETLDKVSIVSVGQHKELRADLGTVGSVSYSLIW
jgi:hypothetical protein